MYRMIQKNINCFFMFRYISFLLCLQTLVRFSQIVFDKLFQAQWNQALDTFTVCLIVFSRY